MFGCKRVNLNVQVATYGILQRAQQEEGANHVWEWASALCFCEVLLKEMEITHTFQLLISLTKVIAACSY